MAVLNLNCQLLFKNSEVCLLFQSVLDFYSKVVNPAVVVVVDIAVGIGLETSSIHITDGIGAFTVIDTYGCRQIGSLVQGDIGVISVWL